MSMRGYATTFYSSMTANTSSTRMSLGISHGDGSLHLGFDQHDNDLNYRMSKTGVATNPSEVAWSADLFGPTLVRLLSNPMPHLD